MQAQAEMKHSKWGDVWFSFQIGLLLYGPMLFIGLIWEKLSIVIFIVLALCFIGGALNYPLMSVRGWKGRWSGFVFLFICWFLPAYLSMLLVTSGYTIGENVQPFHGLPFPFSWVVVGFTLTILTTWFWSPYQFKLNRWRDKGYKKPMKAPVDGNLKETLGSDDPTALYPAHRPRFTFKDVDGMSALKKNISTAIHNFREEGGNGILFYGLPGNGKTFITEAVAGELKLGYIEARTSELSSKWMGESTIRITTLFNAAKLQAPCLIFLDEIDSFLMDRGGDMHQDARQSANTLLTAISDLNKGFKEHGVLVCAATNFLDKLDEAGIREGRFDAKIEVTPPDVEARKGILMAKLDKGLVQIDEEGIDLAVKRWEGFSVARMMSVAKMANRMAKEQQAVVDFDLLGLALREVQGRSGEQLSENTQSLSDLSFSKDQTINLRAITNVLKDRDVVESYGGAISRGALFFGPAGTGKTVVAKAVAKEIGWAFLSTNGQALIQAPDEIDKLIQKASDLRPTIVFIDEAEDLLGDREMNPHTRQVTNKLLAVMDGPKPLHDVFFIASTNHPGNVDPAMMRWGRFSELIDFTPNIHSLQGVLTNFVKSREEKVNFEGDLEALSHRLMDGNYAPADTIGLLNRKVSEAALNRYEGEIKVTVNFDGMP